MSASSSLDLSAFYPKETEIRRIVETDDEITIHLKSHTRTQCCPECGEPSSVYHSTYRRRLQDLPILGKATRLHLAAYRYYCETEGCAQKVFCETIDDFSGTYKRMTGRLEDFLIALASQTSCEGASRIAVLLGIRVSGDTLIRLLLERAETLETVKTDMIGIDDWAYRKGATYGTIIVDGYTHRTIDLLDGRDGKALKEWLAQNKQVKVVTRDRANAYAAAIQEILPEAMQVADRFHLHQNLMDVLRQVMAQELPDKIRLNDELATDAISATTSPVAVKADTSKKN